MGEVPWVVMGSMLCVVIHFIQQHKQLFKHSDPRPRNRAVVQTGAVQIVSCEAGLRATLTLSVVN